MNCLIVDIQSVQKPEEFQNPTQPEFSGFSWAWHEKPETLLSETPPEPQPESSGSGFFSGFSGFLDTQFFYKRNLFYNRNCSITGMCSITGSILQQPNALTNQCFSKPMLQQPNALAKGNPKGDPKGDLKGFFGKNANVQCKQYITSQLSTCSIPIMIRFKVQKGIQKGLIKCIKIVLQGVPAFRDLWYQSQSRNVKNREFRGLFLV